MKLEKNKAVARGGKEVDTHSRLIYLLVAFGIVTILTVIGCFGCSQERLNLTEAEILEQLKVLRGSQWIADSAQDVPEVNGLFIDVIVFSANPNAEMDLEAHCYESGNSYKIASHLHGNAHGFVLTIAEQGFGFKYSESTDGATRTISIEDVDGHTFYYMPK